MGGVIDLVQSTAEMTDEALYEHDFPAWCERQAERLRDVAIRAAGPGQPDWLHVIEEIEDMGAAERHRVEGLLVQAISHLIKLQAAPDGTDATHWTIEIRTLLDDAAAAFAPSMSRSINVDRLYQRALFRLTGRRDSIRSPFALDDLIDPLSDVAKLLAKLP